MNSAWNITEEAAFSRRCDGRAPVLQRCAHRQSNAWMSEKYSEKYVKPWVFWEIAASVRQLKDHEGDDKG